MTRMSNNCHLPVIQTYMISIQILLGVWCVKLWIRETIGGNNKYTWHQSPPGSRSSEKKWFCWNKLKNREKNKQKLKKRNKLKNENKNKQKHVINSKMKWKPHLILHRVRYGWDYLVYYDIGLYNKATTAKYHYLRKLNFYVNFLFCFLTIITVTHQAVKHSQKASLFVFNVSQKNCRELKNVSLEFCRPVKSGSNN